MGVKKEFPKAPTQTGGGYTLDGAREPEDPINPAHYRHGIVESIELIESLGWGKGFCLANAMKYLYRAEHKGNETENLQKALWYIQRRLKQLVTEETLAPHDRLNEVIGQ